MRLNEYLATKTANHLVADAAAIKDHLKDRHRKLPPCTVIPYGAPEITEADPSLLQEYGVDANSYYLVVARLEPENHIMEIISGFLSSDTKKPLIIVGNIAPETPYVKKLLDLSSDDPRVKFVNGVYQQNKLQALRYFSAAYFHGHSVGGTNPSLLEAMGCENLIIAHDNPFNKEVAEDGALYFKEPGDIPAILTEIETNPNNMDRFSSLAKERLARHYHWDSIAEKYMTLIEEYTQ